MRHGRPLLNCFLLFVFSSQIVFPKSHTGKIEGLVVDEQGKPIPALHVLVIGSGRGDATDRNGYFVIENIEQGIYTVQFDHISYKTREIENLVLSGDLSIDLKTVIMTPHVIPLPGVVVTATRTERRDTEVSQPVNIVPGIRIVERNAKTSAEALREETGIFVQKTSHGGGSAIIRGLGSNQILLLVDGVRLNNSTCRLGNHQYLTTIDNFIVDRLEVVRGPTSVLYGSDALGGTVNAITKTPAPAGVEASLDYRIQSRYASADREKTARIETTLRNHRWALLSGFSYSDYEDLRRGENSDHPELERSIDGPVQKPTGFRTYDVDSKLVCSIRPGQRLILAYQMARKIDVPRYDKYENNGCHLWLYTPLNRDLVYLTYENRSKGKFLSSLRASVSCHIQEEGREKQKETTDPLIKERDKVNTLGLALQSNSEFKNHYLTFGVDVYSDNVSSERRTVAADGSIEIDDRGRYPDDATYTSFGTFLQDEIRIGKNVTATTGIRYSRFGTNFSLPQEGAGTGLDEIHMNFQSLTGSLGFIYKCSEFTYLNANIGQAFRAPNLSDMSKLGESKGDTYEVPNTDLEPEKMLSVDTGFKIQSECIQASASAYFARITDLLASADATWNGSPVFTVGDIEYKVKSKQNIGDACIRGVEVSLNIHLTGRLSFYGNLTTTFGRNITGDEPVGGIPPAFGLTGFEWRKEWYHVTAYTRFATEQDRLSADDMDDPRIPEGGTPGWYTLNLRGGFPAWDKLNIYLAVENILDLNYREHGSGVNGPGRNFIISMIFGD